MTKSLPVAFQVFSFAIFLLAAWGFVAIVMPLISGAFWAVALLLAVAAIVVVVCCSRFPWLSNLIFGAYSTVCAAHLLALCVFLKWNSFGGGEVAQVAQYYYLSSGLVAIGHVAGGALGLFFMAMTGDRSLVARAKATAVGMIPSAILVFAAAFVCVSKAPFDPSKTSGLVRDFLDGKFVGMLDFAGYLTHCPIAGRALFAHWIVWFFGIFAPVCLLGWTLRVRSSEA